MDNPRRHSAIRKAIALVRQKHPTIRKAIVAGGIAITLASGTHLGLKAHVDRLNVEVAAENASPVVGAAPYVPVKLAYHRLLQGQVQQVVFNPNKPGNSSGYAVMAAKRFGKNYALADAWDLPLKNRVVASSVVDRAKCSGGFSKDSFEKMISDGTISPGTIIGVYCPDSKNNRPGKQFTHMLVFAGKGVFWHNNSRGPKVISLEEIFSSMNNKGQREFLPVSVIAPVEKQAVQKK
ncbi:MAG: hypothetical protein WC634_02225 [archaeon]